jgi:predicted ATPase
VREAGAEPLVDRLSAVLQDQRHLLVLDNFEQIVEAAPSIASLVAACPALTVLVTSRMRLRLSEEYEFSVPPLALPELQDQRSVREQDVSAAVQLFIERARAIRTDFAITDDNAHAVAGICRRLDGLPLAIELAAARIKVLSPGALLARLERRLPLLTGGGRDRPARQQTMRDAIAWSYDLLRPDEQALFRRLAVFAGGFTLEAAAAVAGIQNDGGDLLETIGALVEASLVRAETVASEPRFGMFETIREYAWERLVASGEEEAAQERHARW